MYEMVAGELDPDVVRWGLQDLEVRCPTNGNYGNSVTLCDTNFGTLGYVREGFNEPETKCVEKEHPVTQFVEVKDSVTASVENDAVIAQLLQEELSKVAVVEGSGYHSPSQASVVAQRWSHEQSKHGKESGRETFSISGQEKKDLDTHDMVGEEMKNGTRQVEICSRPDYSEGSLLSFLEIEEDSADLDSEVGKRLNHMVPIPHVPKINGELPSEDEQMSDHERLHSRLQLYGLVENKVSGDGNCQFRSLSDQLYRSPQHHKFVREQIVHQLKCNRETYEGYLPMAYNEYLKRMSRSGEWGDHVTLQAAADWFGVRIFMITSFKDTCYIEILPHKQKSNRVVCLSFWAEVHYNSIYPEGELPELEGKKKKKWWPL